MRMNLKTEFQARRNADLAETAASLGRRRVEVGPSKTCGVIGAQHVHQLLSQPKGRHCN